MDASRGRPLTFRLRFVAAVFAALLFAGSLPLPLAAAGSTIKLTYSPANFTFHYPEDLRLIRNVTVTNTASSNYYEMIVVPHFYGKNVSLGDGTVFPQGAGLVLQPSQSQFVSVTLDLSKIAQVWSTGQTYHYNITLEIGPIVKGPGCAQPTFCIDRTRSQNATLSNTVQVLCTCMNLPTNSSVYGRVYDRSTALPVAGAEVSILGTQLNYTPVSTDVTGLYNISVTAFRSADTGAWAPLDIHVTVPNSSFYGSDAIVYPRPGNATVQDFLLDHRTQSGYYKVLSKFQADGGLNLGKSAFSGNGSFFAAVTYATGEASQSDIVQNSSLYFFSANGTMLWKFNTNTATSALDVSDDAKYVATASGTSSNPVPQLADVFTTGGVKVWTLNATSVPGSKGNLSLYWTPDQWTSLKFSHDDYFLAAGTKDGFLYLFSVGNRQVVWEKFLGGSIDALRFSQDGSVVYASSGDGYVYAFSTGPAGTRFWKTYAFAGANGIGFSNNYIVVSPRTGNYIVLLDRSGNLIWRAPVEASFPGTRVAINQRFIAFFGSDPFPYSGIMNINGSLQVLLGPAATGAISLDANYILWSGLAQGSPATMLIQLLDTQGHPILNFTDPTSAQPGCGGAQSWIGSQETRLMVVTCSSVYFLSGYVATTFINTASAGGVSYQVPIISNSTVSNFLYDKAANGIFFTSSLGSRAFFNVTIPIALLSGNLTVSAGGTPINASIVKSSDSYIVSVVCGYNCNSMAISGPSQSNTTTTTTTTTSNATTTNSTTTGPPTTTTTVTVTQPTTSQGFQISSSFALELLVVAAVAAGVVVLAASLYFRRSPRAASTQPS